MSASNFVKSIIGNEDKSIKSNTYTNQNETLKFSLARIMLTGVIKNQYYRSFDEQLNEALPLIINFAKKNPEYLLKACSFARKADMKGMVLLGLASLSANASIDFLNDNKSTIISLLSTFHPKLLMQFVDLLISKKLGKGFGSRPQKYVRTVMEGWTAAKVEENTLKYATDFYALLRLVHPRYIDERASLVNYLLSEPKKKIKKYSFNSNKGMAFGNKQKAVEQMKAINDGNNENKIAKLMLDNSVPWDCVKGFHPIKGYVGLSMMTQMGLSALLLNIKSLEQNGILDDNNGIKALELKLNEVKNGRSIPIDFAKPYIHSTNPKVKDLLVKAIVSSLSNSMPHIENRRIGVSVDISGSMDGEPLVTAGLLSVPFLKAKNLWFTTFDTKLYEHPELNRKSADDQVHHLLNLNTDGGTNVAISLEVALKKEIVLDLHVLITDEQQNSGTPIMKVWNNYKKSVNPRAELWVINATNQNWHAADFNDPSVTVYQTMTPAIFNNLQFVGQDLISAIDAVDLNN